ncbi:MAG: FAD-dependent oxidoreductase [Deltaproteobacteria bacterium]|nr:FAD-dependent oxidoreductase [Deltaproteobacteria bacterium]
MPSNGPLLRVNICTFPGKSLKAAKAVQEAFLNEMKERSLDDLGPLEVNLVGWRGIEGRDVVVEVRDSAGAHLYELITPDMVARIIQSHIDEKRPVQRWLVGKDFRDFVEPQKRYVSELVGQIDPLSWEEYQDYDGYKGLQTFFSQGFDSFLQKVVAAGFCEFARITTSPLGKRWCELRVEKEQPILVVNAAPPTPDASSEMFLLEGCPHQVLEGILLAAKTLKAQAAIVYLAEEDELARERMQQAINACVAAPIWPRKEPLIEVKVVSGHGRYMMEDEELFIRGLSGLLPRTFWDKYPRRIFLTHSLGTIASLPFIAQTPVAWFRKLGVECAPGTMIFRLHGSVERPGFVEVPLSATLHDIIHGEGGGFRFGRTPKGVQVGGPLGGIFPVSLLNMNLAHETLKEMGATLSVGSIQVLDDRDCLVSLVREQVEFILNQPGGQYPACQEPLLKIKDLLEQISEGIGSHETLKELQTRAQALKMKGACELARHATNPLLTALHYFPEEFRLHLENKHCPARACPKLLLAPCHQACPTGIDVPSFIGLIAQGNYQEAWEVMREDNPFPWVCGLVCPHPCERACVRASLDEPINIRYLKAFAAEWVSKHGKFFPPQPAPANAHKVAVVGSGPAGLSCAYFLALRGYQVTVFEALAEPGGLLMAAIPDYRLAREVVRKEIRLLRSLGVEIKTNVMVGRGLTLDDLRAQGYEAIFLGIGAHLGYKLKIEGEADFPQVYDVISFLRDIYLGKKEKHADKMLIIGGGNAAMDAARTCVRLGCSEVHVSYRRTRAEMPAHPEEVEQALEEGVQIHFLTVPIKIGGENGQVTHVECLRAELGRPDASGRRRPLPIPESNYIIEAGAVITAIGQQPDFCPFPEPPVQTTPWCTIVTQPGSTRTSLNDVFAGGDGVTGPATVVDAIAAGKQAAAEIDHFITGATSPALVMSPQKRRKVSFQTIPAFEKIANHRTPIPMLDVELRKTTFIPVEMGYSDAQAQKEAQRCLRCDICIRCGACERACHRMRVHALKFSQITTTERVLTDYPLVANTCIACGACALACPTQAIDYQEGPDFREVRLCGTVLNHLETPKCQACGEPLPPARYLQYVTDRSDAAMDKQVLRLLCPNCARTQRAARFVKL